MRDDAARRAPLDAGLREGGHDRLVGCEFCLGGRSVHALLGKSPYVGQRCRRNNVHVGGKCDIVVGAVEWV